MPYAARSQGCVLHALVEGAGDNFQLVFARKFHEVHGVAADADGELRIFLGVHHGVFQHFAVEDVHVEVVCSLGEVAVNHGDEVLHAFFVGGSEALRHDAEGVGDAVLGVAVAEFCHRGERSDCTALVSSVHRVCAGSEGNAAFASVGCCAGFLSIHHVGSDGQQRESRTCVLIDGEFLEFFGEEVNEVHAEVVHTVVVVAEAGELALDVEGFGESDVVAFWQ